jgi:hypothetical protein
MTVLQMMSNGHRYAVYLPHLFSGYGWHDDAVFRSKEHHALSLTYPGS